MTNKLFISEWVLDSSGLYEVPWAFVVVWLSIMKEPHLPNFTFSINEPFSVIEKVIIDGKIGYEIRQGNLRTIIPARFVREVNL